jgi:hypothetical protein
MQHLWILLVDLQLSCPKAAANLAAVSAANKRRQGSRIPTKNANVWAGRRTQGVSCAALNGSPLWPTTSAIAVTQVSGRQSAGFV